MGARSTSHKTMEGREEGREGKLLRMRAGIGAAAVSGLILTPARPLALFDSLILWLEQSPPKKERAKSEGVKERLQPGSLI